MPERGEVYNRERAQQIRDFSGMRFGSITPTDIDGLIEYRDTCYVFIEAKLEGYEMKDGQRLALERLIDDLDKPAVLFVCEHDTAPQVDIDMANTTATKCYINGKWLTFPEEVTLRSAVDRFINKYGATHENQNH